MRVEDGRVVFRVRYPGAQTVQVIGSFNAWDAARGELHPTDDGVFVGRFDASSGRHRYRLLVDGEPRLPEDAVPVADDFGGVDAIIDVR